MIGKVIGVVFKIGLVAVFALGVFTWAYFVFYKADQPMQVPQAQAIAPGITYREFWNDRRAGWQAIDKRRYATGQTESKTVCDFSWFYKGFWIPKAIVLEPGLRVLITRTWPGTSAANYWLAGGDDIIAPADLGALDAWWWQIENESWDYWKIGQAGGYPVCRLRFPNRPQQAAE